MKSKVKRDAGIDLLRIVCMLMIVSMHFFSHSGIWETIPLFSANYLAAKAIIAFCRCSVNCFVLIGGYLNFGKEFSSKRAAAFALQTWTYSAVLLVIATVGTFIVPSSAISVRGMLPLSTKMYWFMSTYFGMLLLTPALNKALQMLPYQTLRRSVGSGFVMFCIMNYIYPNADLFYLNRGYSLIWFVFLYATGAMLKRKELEDGNGTDIICPAILYMIPALISFGGELLFVAGAAPFPEIYKHVLTDYSSPTTFLSAVGLFLWFRKVTVKNEVVTRAIIFLGTNTLGVYLLHEWPYLRDTLWKNIFIPAAYGNSNLMIAYLLFCVVVIFSAGILVESIRGSVARRILNQRLCLSCFEKIDALLGFKGKDQTEK